MFVRQIISILVVVKSLQIDGLPISTSSELDDPFIAPSDDVSRSKIQTIEVRRSRSSKGRKYIPLNSLTLSRHTGETSGNEEHEDEMEADHKDDIKPMKRPWWQSLPQNKNKKNKVILDEYDKLKSSVPEWPWIEALKSSSLDGAPLTRKKVQDKVRVVMADKGTTSTMITMPSETTTPLIETASPNIMMEDHLEDMMAPQKSITDEMNFDLMEPNMMKDKMKPDKMNEKMKDEMVHEMDQMHKIAMEMKKKSKTTTTKPTTTTTTITTTTKSKKPQGLPSWLASLQSDMEKKVSTMEKKASTTTTLPPSTTSTEEPDWFANIFSSAASTLKESLMESTTTTKKPFRMPDFAALNKPKNENKAVMLKDPLMKEDVPMVKINGPTIHLPSFPLISDKLKLFSGNSALEEDDEEKAEQRTASIDGVDEDFDLNFFPMRESVQDAQARFPLLANQHNLGDLEASTEQVPEVGQSLTPMENREALTQLVSLYEWAPTLKGEKDKTEPQAVPMEKEKKKKPMNVDEMDKDKMKMDDNEMEEDKVHMYSSGGIPHSVTLQQLANDVKKPQISKVDKPSYLVPEPEPGMLYSEPKETVPVNVKQTLALILQQNTELTRLLQSRLNEQSRLINILMKQIQW